jgi:hypothetical protein
MTKAEQFYDRYNAGDDEEVRAATLADAIDEAVAVYIDGELSDRRDDLGDALANHETVKLFFADHSALEFVPLARDGFFIGWSE